MSESEKVIQLVIDPETEYFYGSIFALTNRGNIWALRGSSAEEEKWEPVPLPPLNQES